MTEDDQDAIEEDIIEAPNAKKSKTLDTESEVESILSGKLLDTNIPGLEEFMSSESKFYLLLYTLENKSCWLCVSNLNSKLQLWNFGFM